MRHPPPPVNPTPELPLAPKAVRAAPPRAQALGLAVLTARPSEHRRRRGRLPRARPSREGRRAVGRCVPVGRPKGSEVKAHRACGWAALGLGGHLAGLRHHADSSAWLACALRTRGEGAAARRKVARVRNRPPSGRPCERGGSGAGRMRSVLGTCTASTSASVWKTGESSKMCFLNIPEKPAE